MIYLAHISRVFRHKSQIKPRKSLGPLKNLAELLVLALILPDFYLKIYPLKMVGGMSKISLLTLSSIENVNLKEEAGSNSFVAIQEM